MAATALSPTARYMPVGKRQYYWVDAIASKAAPTRSELDAGTDLTGEIPNDGVAGFSTTSDSLDAGDMKSRFVPKVPGLINAEDSSMNFYNDEDGEDIRTVLSRDDEGFIVIFPEGDEDDHTMDVFPVKVATVAKQQDGTAVAQIQVQFTITSEPAEDVDVPATGT